MKLLALDPPYHPRYSRSQRSPAVIKSGVVYCPIWLAWRLLRDIPASRGYQEIPDAD